jgi:hypothetical protein
LPELCYDVAKRSFSGVEVEGAAEMTEQEYLSKNQKTAQKKQKPASSPSAPVNIQRMDAGDLQRLVGNRQMQRMLGQRQPDRKPSLFIQTKLTVGAANDTYEQEADSVANKVMTMPDAPVQRQGNGNVNEEEQGNAMRIQRQNDDNDEDMAAMRIQRQEKQEEDQPLMAKRLMRDMVGVQRQNDDNDEDMAAKRIQRQNDDNDEDMAAMRIQRQNDDNDEDMAAKRIQREGGVDMMGSFDVGEDVEKSIDSTRGSGAPLPDEARGFFEDRMGYDFGGVNVHTDSNAQNVNSSIQAQAFTTGKDIYFNADKYNPGSDDGKRLLGHELTHVVQQGGASPKVQTDRDEKK